MPKLSNSKLKFLISQYPGEQLETDGIIVRCGFCDASIKVDDKHQKQQVEQHINGIKHRELKARSSAASSSKQSFIAEAFKNGEAQNKSLKEFGAELTSTFIQVGIPLSKLSQKPLRQFLEKYTGKSIPDESTLRKIYIKPIYDAVIEKIKTVIADYPVLFILDETTDKMKRYVLNILVAPINGKPVKPMLFKVCFNV